MNEKRTGFWPVADLVVSVVFTLGIGLLLGVALIKCVLAKPCECDARTFGFERRDPLLLEVPDPDLGDGGAP